MTRESKLALIVGFGLILFVGILVSDHFSAGQRQEAAHLLAQRGAARQSSAPISIQPLQPAVSSVVQQVRTGASAPTERDEPANPVQEIPRDEIRPQIGMGPTSVAGTNPAADQGDTRPAETQGDAAVRLYPVKEGETLYSIAASQYGDGSLWQALAEFNKAAVPSPARMRKGVTLRLPPVQALKPGASPRDSGAAGGGSADRPDRPVRQGQDETMARGPRESEPATRSAPTNYTVQRGETLTRIAEKTLGSSARWKEIARLNKDVLSDPHALVPGTVLRVPDRG